MKRTEGQKDCRSEGPQQDVLPESCPMCPEELEALEPDDALALDDNIRHWLSGHDRLALPEGGLSRFRPPGAQVGDCG